MCGAKGTRRSTIFTSITVRLSRFFSQAPSHHAGECAANTYPAAIDREGRWGQERAGRDRGEGARAWRRALTGGVVPQPELRDLLHILSAGRRDRGERRLRATDARKV